jgi:hypothetical protein
LSIQFCFLSTDQAEKGKGMSKIGWTMGMQRVRASQALNL